PAARTALSPLSLHDALPICGWVMAQVDIAGSIPAWERAAGPVVTVAVNSFLFREPVFVGDLVSFYARVLKIGRTSITVDVEVFADRKSTRLNSSHDQISYAV